MSDPVAPPDAAPARRSDRVPVSQKLTYGLGTFNTMWGTWLYVTLVWPVFNIYLGVPGTLIGLVLLITRLVDAVSDPFFGWWSDNTKSRWGRRRPFLLVGGLLSGLTLPLLFLAPQGWTEMQYFWFMVLTSSISITLVSAFSVPFESLGMEMTPDYGERTSIYGFRTFIQKLPEAGMFAAPLVVTSLLFANSDGTRNALRGAQWYTLGAGVFMAFVGVLMFGKLRERYYANVVSRRAQRTGFLDTFAPLRNRNFVAQMLTSITFLMSTQVVGTLGYYVTLYYICGGNQVAGNWWNLWGGLGSSALGMIGISFYSWLGRRVGKIACMRVVQVSMIVAYALTWVLYTPEHKYFLILASGLIMFTNSGFWGIYGAVGADIVDQDELQNGKRREGAFAAGGTWISKVAIAVGTLIAGAVLDLTGFQSSLGADQSEHTIFMLRFLVMGIPICGIILSIISFSFFKLTRERVEWMRKELEARRGEV